MPQGVRHRPGAPASRHQADASRVQSVVRRWAEDWLPPGCGRAVSTPLV